MNSQTLLYRLVHPAHVHAGMITSQVFRPQADSCLLTVFDETAITPEEVWRWSWDFLPQGIQFTGIVAVDVGECRSLGLSVQRADTHPAGHSVIDFSGLSRGQLRRTAAFLRECARARGWVIRADNSPWSGRSHPPCAPSK
jgi:hypothetical protein